MVARVFLTGRRVKYTKTRPTRITFDTQLKIALKKNHNGGLLLESN